MSEENVPYNAGLGDGLDEEEMRGKADRTAKRLGQICEEALRVQAHASKNTDGELDPEWVQEKFRLITHALRKLANEVDPGP
jgi:hypothetical protein